MTGTGVSGTTTLACTVAARSCSSTPAFPATSSASQSASKPACGWGVAPLAEADAAAASVIGPLPTMATRLPSREPSAPRAAATALSPAAV